MSAGQVVYLAEPDCSTERVAEIAAEKGCLAHYEIYRRGVHLGWVGVCDLGGTESQLADDVDQWKCGNAVLISTPQFEKLEAIEPDMERTYRLVEGVLDGEPLVQLLDENGYFDRLGTRYAFMGGFTDESDFQGIEQLEFEAVDGERVLGDGIWMKASWLSFEDDDASLRFRFSYGREGLEDVASDFERERLTGELAEIIFPESSLVTKNEALIERLSALSGVKTPAFVERIFYFNAPNGGALFHHDVERGHDGVVYMQLVGSTAWLALAKPLLLDALLEFLQRENIESLLSDFVDSAMRDAVLAQRTDRQYWSDRLNDREDESVEILLNHIPAFFAALVDQGYARILQPGDIILLPQATLEDCCWHTVFCLDDYPGEALSFAFRETPVS